MKIVVLALLLSLQTISTFADDLAIEASLHNFPVPCRVLDALDYHKNRTIGISAIVINNDRIVIENFIRNMSDYGPTVINKQTDLEITELKMDYKTKLRELVRIGVCKPYQF
jgi:hypothetical protein